MGIEKKKISSFLSRHVMLCHVMPFRLFTKNTYLPFSSRASAGLYTKLLLKLLDNLRVKNFKSTEMRSSPTTSGWVVRFAKGWRQQMMSPTSSREANVQNKVGEESNKRGYEN